MKKKSCPESQRKINCALTSINAPPPPPPGYLLVNTLGDGFRRILQFYPQLATG